jgi:hypothetical protein
MTLGMPGEGAVLYNRGCPRSACPERSEGKRMRSPVAAHGRRDSPVWLTRFDKRSGHWGCAVLAADSLR